MARSTRKIALAVLGNVGPPAAAFITAPVLAQSLGVFERGQVAAGTAPLMLAASAATLGLPEAVTYFVARAGAARASKLVAKAMAMIALAGLVASAFFFALTPLLASGDEVVVHLIHLSLAMLVPSLVLLVLRAVSAGRGRWGLIALERSIGSASRLIAVVALAMSGNLTVVTATISISASMWVGVVAYVGLLRHGRAHEPTKTRSADLLGYGTRVWFGALAGVLLSRVDQLLIAPFSNAFELGIYVVAVAIAELVLVFNNAVRDVYFAEESRAPNMKRVARAARISSLVTVALALVVACASVWGIPLLFGEEFHPAIVPTWILLAAIVLGNPGSLAGAGLSAYGRPHLRSWSLLVALISNVIVVALLVPLLGAVGAAIATAVGNVIAAGLNLVWVRRVDAGVTAMEFVTVRREDFSDLIRMMTRGFGGRGAT